MNTKEPNSKKILSGIGILLNGIYSAIGLTEFYLVEIKKDTELYPFGGEGLVLSITKLLNSTQL